MDEFYQTRAGRQFIDSTMPRIADELAKLNENLESLVQTLKERTHAEVQPEPE